MKHQNDLRPGDLVRWTRYRHNYKDCTITMAKIIAVYPNHSRIQVIEDNPLRLKDPIVPNSKLTKVEVS